MNYFAHEIDGKFRHVFSNEIQVKMCGREPIIPVEVTIDETGEYFGWLDFKDQKTKPCMIYDSLLLLDCCFPYGMKAEIDAGKGKMVKLTIRKKE